MNAIEKHVRKMGFNVRVGVVYECSFRRFKP